MSIEIVPTGAAFGAEIRGVDLARPIDDETFAAIEHAYNDYAVIFFRDQHITPQNRCFTRRQRIEFNISANDGVPGSPRSSFCNDRGWPSDRRAPRWRELAQ